MPSIEEVTDEEVPKTKTYDEMTPEEREVHDAEARAKEAEEQSSKRSSGTFIDYSQLSSA
jgi:hypothetical protein